MTKKLEGLTPVSKSEVRAATEVLARAFLNYPDLEYLFPDERARKKIAFYFLAVAVHTGIRYGEVYCTPGMEGVAIWLPPGHWQLTTWMILRSVPLPIIFGFGMRGGGRLRSLDEHIESVHRRVAPFKHWYLETIGVDPQFKGKGYASKLILPMLARIDKQGLPCYLETGDEKNVALYEHFGFRVIDKSSVPDTSLINWAMLRRS